MSYPGIRFTFCFNGEDAAKEQASRLGNVIFWKDKQRMIAVPAIDGVAIFPFEHRDDCYRAALTTQVFNGTLHG